ncbi:helix-turn-helix domain-containing protein [Sunxiuqinia elliptica]|uniref:AraC-like DNA-binding protein n=1 Tax=Sunxiuqinia elliptica TaxID=655355 RepID=A0A4R6GSG7_9BACT|nr:helix-turn-helix domain-containing protein [Sunxiuqinia elliptica]TDN97690.1 AraC-like DNA-binding protein [Sunxiuqinia elliptica]TDO67045.1 AraC-like DNA-binding protein [Sunxiuqinia elliptica]
MQEITVRNIQISPYLNNFQVIRFEDIYLDKNMEEGLHRHDFFFLMILEKANGKHHVDFTNIPVTSNTVTFLRPGQVHELILHKGSKGYLITFNSEYYYKKILRRVSQQNIYKLDQVFFEQILNISRNIFEEFTTQEKGFENIIKANLDILFVLLSRDISKKIESKKFQNLEEQELLDKLLYLVEHQICNSKQVTDYARELHSTSYKLNNTTKNLLGKTCSQLINEQIILESKRLLLATSNQINEIAFKLGYEDPAYFIRFFKRHTSYTPKAYRQHFKKVPFI